MGWPQVYLLPGLYVIALWWSSTLLLMRLAGGARSRGGTWAVALGLLGLGAGLLLAERGRQASADVYLSFLAGVLCWSGLDASYYSGLLLGPRRGGCLRDCPRTCGPRRRFRHALGANLYHELAAAALVAFVAAVQWGAPNQLGLWTVCTLWGAGRLARLNVFVGLPNLRPEMLPAALAGMRQFVGSAPPGGVFLASELLLGGVAASLLIAGLLEGRAFHGAALWALGVLLALATLELLVLALPRRAPRRPR